MNQSFKVFTLSRNVRSLLLLPAVRHSGTCSNGTRPPTKQNQIVFGSWNKLCNENVTPNYVSKRNLNRINVDFVRDLSKIGVSVSKGTRSSLEDLIDIQTIGEEFSYFAVFDGHGGRHACEFAKQRIPHYLKHWMNDLQVNSLNENELIHEMKLILKKTFVAVNNAFAANAMRDLIGTISNNCGTTATVILYHHPTKNYFVSHVGDSTAICAKKSGDIVKLTSPLHTCENDFECDRITAHGGVVAHSNSMDGVKRVNGRLGMTRSIGDLELKKFGVTSEPTVNHYKLDMENDSYIILTTDGISQVFNDQTLCDLISTTYKTSSSRTATTLAKNVTDAALQNGSDDNVTTILIPCQKFHEMKSKFDSKTSIELSKQQHSIATINTNLFLSRYA
ncbi:hypothetical protein SNEBB_000500 [Seison nebaliae]|nr:hypothetical protein SNEBB_000500 [Seison nebaliae]